VNVRDLFDLTGRVALVTGGATGLGRQLAEALAEAGADVALCARDAARCATAAGELSALGVRALGIGCDVRRAEDVEAAVQRVVGELGAVDILVNNAGTAWGAPPEDVPLAGWQKVIDVNLTGTFLVTQAVGRWLIERGEGGKIVNIASVAAYRGAPPEAMDALPYNASKGGIVALTVDLAVKWARHGITVNAIAPGWFPTELTAHTLERAGEAIVARIPLGRVGGEDDLKGAVVYLASRASDFVTGTTLVVDGGQLAG
jgi:gluconate 5-dehydrogenase